MSSLDFLRLMWAVAKIVAVVGVIVVTFVVVFTIIDLLARNKD